MKIKTIYILLIILLSISCNYNRNDSTRRLSDTIDIDSLDNDFSSEELQEMMLGVNYCVAHPNDPKYGANRNGDKECYNDIEKTKGKVYIETESEKRYYTKDSLPKEGFIVIYENGEFVCCGAIENFESIP